MSTKLEISNNHKPLLIRKLHKHGNYFSVGLPEVIRNKMKVKTDNEYFKVWYSDDLNGVVYQKLEDVKN
jgi:hypothetical protein